MKDVMDISESHTERPANADMGLLHGERRILARQIDRGIQMSFSLSLAAVPISYLTQVVLARTSQQAVGIFGSILIWSALALCFFFFGGNSVLIKFLPELPRERRFPFLLSYGGIVLGFTVLCMGILALFPGPLRYLAGPGTMKVVLPLLFLIGAVNILQQFLLSALKGFLELGVAQLLMRISTVGYLAIFGSLFLMDAPLFRRHMLLVIAAVHIATVGLSSLLAVFYLLPHLEIRKSVFRGIFPEGFWRFSVLTQLSSTVNFFYSRLDQVFVLLYASISGLGIYFVMAQLAGAIQLISGFFLDGLLPAFTNVLARLGAAATRSVYYQGARLNQVIVTASALFLISFDRPILSVFGGEYPRYWPVLLVLAFFSGINSLGTLNAYLLTSMKRMGVLLFSQCLQIAVFVILFFALGGRHSFLRLALAQGAANLLALVVLIVLTARSLPFKLRVPRECWASLVMLSLAGGLVAWMKPLSFPVTILFFGIALGAFFLAGGYRWDEIRSLLSLALLQRGREGQSFAILPEPGLPQINLAAGNVPEGKI